MSTAYYAAMSAGPKTKRGRIELLRAALVSTRQSGFDSHYRDLADHLAPRRVRFWIGDRNKGDKRNQNIIDSTGRFAARTLQSGFHAGVSSPARPWFNLTTPDPSLAEFGPVKEWLFTVTQRMRTIFSQTNLYNALPIVYGDLGVFGTAAMATTNDTVDLFRAQAYLVGSYGVSMNERGVVNTLYREYEMTVRQCVKEFGVRPGSTEIDWSPFSVRVKTAWERGDYETPVQVGWMVQPNEDINPRALAAYKRLPFTSCHFEIDQETIDAGVKDDKFLRESGFKNFPAFVPRWDVGDGDSYGIDCPGMSVLGDVRQLQIMARRKGQLLAKAVDPPLKGPSSLRSQKTSLIQGDITYVDAREGQQGLEPIHEVRLEGFQHLTADINDVRYQVRRGFYEDLFLMLAMSDPSRGLQPITAREVEERHEEKLLVLGPVLDRLNDELFEPLVDRTYMQMEDAGLIPDPPDELDGVELKVEFISILHQAQKSVGAAAQDQFIQKTAGLAPVFPEVRHKIKVFQVVDAYRDIYGVDPRQVRTNEEAQSNADAEAQAMQAQAAAEAAKNLGAGMAAAGKAPIAPNSPLDAMLAAQGAGAF